MLTASSQDSGTESHVGVVLLTFLLAPLMLLSGLLEICPILLVRFFLGDICSAGVLLQCSKPLCFSSELTTDVQALFNESCSDSSDNSCSNC